ncbi:hypothetical protein QFZ22_002648 [Streptomyces canus]|uniref:Uncharacterized protein n=1 Tax=Streptomyces canus TaxID=58343 RepID=A0AAW8FAQ4_9ACTN|nr:hypothetical protein [Streptomyces canus]
MRPAGAWFIVTTDGARAPCDRRQEAGHGRTVGQRLEDHPQRTGALVTRSKHLLPATVQIGADGAAIRPRSPEQARPGQRYRRPLSGPRSTGNLSPVWAATPGESGLPARSPAARDLTATTGGYTFTNSSLRYLNSPPSAPPTAPTPPPPPTPARQAPVDVVLAAGGGHFTITDAGKDIWGAGGQHEDEYGTVFRDGAAVDGTSVTARVDNLDNTNGWAKAGVVLRNDLTDDGSSAGYAAVVVTPDNGVGFQRDRNADGYLDQLTSTAATVKAPVWLPRWAPIPSSPGRRRPPAGPCRTRPRTSGRLTSALASTHASCTSTAPWPPGPAPRSTAPTMAQPSWDNNTFGYDNVFRNTGSWGHENSSATNNTGALTLRRWSADGTGAGYRSCS